MKPTALALLLPLLLVLPGTGDDPVIARAKDREFRASELAQWLLVRYGVEARLEFAAGELVQRIAEERGILPTPQEVDAAFQREFDHLVQTFHHGDAESYLSSLRSRGYTAEAWKRKRTAELAVELAQANLARSIRQVTDEQLRAAYREDYGDLGERTTLEVYFLSAYRDVSPMQQDVEIATLRATARARAEAVQAKLAAGAPLAEILPETDPVSSEFVRDGVVAAYRRELLGKEVDKAVRKLQQPGEVSPVIDAWDGAYVVRLVAREPVRFEDVRDALAAKLADVAVDGHELAQVRKLVLDTYALELVDG
jgi:hypothetical protein